MSDDKSNSMQNFTFYRDGKPEKVRREEWRWQAIYDDGTELHQFDEQTGLFHQIGEIDQDRLAVFKMVHDTKGTHTLLFASPEPRRLIHLYKRLVLNDGQLRLTFYVFGYKERDKYHYFVITPDELVITDDLASLKAG